MSSAAPRSDPHLAIAAFLADNPLTCPSCRYNLHKCKKLQCPECGWVIIIPSPPDPPDPPVSPQRYLWCRRCQYDLRGTSAPICPACGENTLFIPSSLSSINSRFITSIDGRAPRIFTINAVMGLLSPLGIIFGVLSSRARAGTFTPGPRVDDILLAVASALLPIVIFFAWRWWRPWLLEREPATRTMFIIIGAPLGTGAAILAAAMFAAL